MFKTWGYLNSGGNMLYTRISIVPDLRPRARPWASTTGLMVFEGMSVSEEELDAVWQQVLGELASQGYVEARLDGLSAKPMRVNPESRTVTVWELTSRAADMLHALRTDRVAVCVRWLNDPNEA